MVPLFASKHILNDITTRVSCSSVWKEISVWMMSVKRRDFSPDQKLAFCLFVSSYATVVYPVLERFLFNPTRLKINLKCHMFPVFEYFKLWNNAKKKTKTWWLTTRCHQNILMLNFSSYTTVHIHNVRISFCNQGLYLECQQSKMTIFKTLMFYSAHIQQFFSKERNKQ